MRTKALRRQGEFPPRDAQSEQDDQDARRALKPLLPLLLEDAPLNVLVFGDDLLLPLLPPEAPDDGSEGLSLVRMWVTIAPKLTDLSYRRMWREYVELMRHELGEDAPMDHPDRIALDEARFWIGDRLATGAASLENPMLQVLFDASTEQAFLAGWLPDWIAESYAYQWEELEEEFAIRREERAIQKITYGPLDYELPRSLTPTIDDALHKLLSGAIDPDRLADTAIEASRRDLNDERRSKAALAFRTSAHRARQQKRPFAAYDLQVIFEILASEGPAAQRAAWLLYSRAIDAHIAYARWRIW